MRRAKGILSSCTVVIPLNTKSVLEITTTATHALDIISGNTVLPTKRVKVLSRDGKPLTKKDLTRLKSEEEA